MLNIDTTKVGDQVGILRCGSFGYTFIEGLHTVTKKDKVKIVLQRNSDEHERKFNLRGRELGNSYSWTYLVSVEEYQIQIDQTAKARAINTGWQCLEKAVSNKNLTDAEAFIKELKLLTK